MESNSSDSSWLDYYTMMGEKFEEGRNINVGLASARHISESRESDVHLRFSDDMKKSHIPELMSLKIETSAHSLAHCNKKGLGELKRDLAALKVKVYEDLVAAQANAHRFLEIEKRIAALVPESNPDLIWEGSHLKLRINELLSEDVGSRSRRKQAPNLLEAVGLIESVITITDKEKEKVAATKLEVYYDTMMPCEIEEETTRSNMELQESNPIEKRLREIKRKCQVILSTLKQYDDDNYEHRYIQILDECEDSDSPNSTFRGYRPRNIQ